MYPGGHRLRSRLDGIRALTHPGGLETLPVQAGLAVGARVAPAEANFHPLAVRPLQQPRRVQFFRHAFGQGLWVPEHVAKGQRCLRQQVRKLGMSGRLHPFEGGTFQQSPAIVVHRTRPIDPQMPQPVAFEGIPDAISESFAGVMFDAVWGLSVPLPTSSLVASTARATIHDERYWIEGSPRLCRIPLPNGIDDNSLNGSTKIAKGLLNGFPGGAKRKQVLSENFTVPAAPPAQRSKSFRQLIDF